MSEIRIYIYIYRYICRFMKLIAQSIEKTIEFDAISVVTKQNDEQEPDGDESFTQFLYNSIYKHLHKYTHAYYIYSYDNCFILNFYFVYTVLYLVNENILYLVYILIYSACT